MSKQKEKEKMNKLILANLNFMISEKEDKIKYEKQILKGLKGIRKYQEKIVLEKKK